MMHLGASQMYNWAAIIDWVAFDELRINNGSHLFVLGASIGYSLVNPLVDSSQDPSGWVACTSKTKKKIWYAIFDRAYKGISIGKENYKNKD